MADIFELRSAALPSESKLVAFRAHERLSGLYRVEAYVSVPSAAEWSPDEVLWSRATLAIDIGPGSPQQLFHGTVAAVEIIHETGERMLARVDLVPKLHELGMSLHSRIYTTKSIPDIVKDVLERGGLTSEDFELKLSGSYASEEHVCQFEESDLDFICRWLEREGIYFFFEQTDDREKLIITDQSGSHATSLRSEPVRYHPVLGDDTSAADSFEVFTSRATAQPKKVTLRDYDYAKPALDVSGAAPVQGGIGGELARHGGRFFTPAEGGRLAKLRAEGHVAAREVFHGRGTAFQLRPGYRFEVAHHTVSALDGKYQCIELRHQGNSRATTTELHELTGIDIDDVYHVDLQAIRAEVQFRPALATKRPRIDGMEVAFIDGPSDSDYAQIDDQGRYRVKFHFDEGELKDGKASTAVRMMQPHGGNPEGWHFPLRKGTEVLISFLAGDPDRPVISGVAPNALNPSPVTSKNHTRNIVHTGGDNHIELEDQDAKQWVDFRTPPKDTFFHLGEPHKVDTKTARASGKDTHYIVANTQGDALFEIGGAQDIHVGGKLTEEVKGAVKETYDTSQTTKISGTQTTIVKGAVTENYDATQLTKVKSTVVEVYGAVQDTDVTAGGRKETFNAGQVTITAAHVGEDYSGGQKKKVTGATVQSYGGKLTTTVSGEAKQTFASTVVQSWGPTTGVMASLDWKIPGGWVTITPKFEIAVPRDLFDWALENKLIQMKIELYGLANSVTGQKTEKTGLALQLQGVGRDAGAVQIALATAYITFTAKKDEDAGFKGKLYGLIVVI